MRGSWITHATADHGPGGISPVLEVLISIRDPLTRDVVRTALRSAGSFRPSIVPRNDLVALLADSRHVDLVILDLDVRSGTDEEFLAEVVRSRGTVGITVVATGAERAQVTRVKLGHDVLTVVPAPIDAFDLARRLRRVAQSLVRR